MKDSVLGLIIGILLLILAYCLYRCSKIIITEAVISSPVEEMYHRQLVVTLDSILDARFGTGCCEEDIDTINTNTFNSRFGGNLSPME